MGFSRRNKFNVAPVDQRKWMGRTWASKAEKERAMELQLLKEAGEILEYTCQPKFYLPDETSVYVADFQVVAEIIDDYCFRIGFDVWIEDVKGRETPKFRADKKRWKKHGKLPLHILKRSGRRWKTEIINPGDE